MQVHIRNGDLMLAIRFFIVFAKTVAHGSELERKSVLSQESCSSFGDAFKSIPVQRKKHARMRGGCTRLPGH